MKKWEGMILSRLVFRLFYTFYDKKRKPPSNILKRAVASPDLMKSLDLFSMEYVNFIVGI